jgi:ComF family protein
VLIVSEAAQSNLIQTIGDVAQLVYPDACSVCGAPVRADDWPWCEECQCSVRFWSRAICPECRVYRDSNFRDCEHPHIPVQPTFVAALGAYDVALGSAVRGFKYSNRKRLAISIASLMADRLSCFSAIDVIVAVPTSPEKRRERGFGHAEEIALHLAKQLALPCRADALHFTRRLADQTRLTAKERQKNLDGAFAVRPDSRCKDKTVLIVDDVMTTGATLFEAARALSEAGACRIGAAVVAVNLGGVSEVPSDR